MLKSFQEIEGAVRSRFDSSLAAFAAIECGCATDETTRQKESWPIRISLGRPGADELAYNMQKVSAYVTELREWSLRCGFAVLWGERRAGGRQQIPTHVVVETPDTAARMMGREAKARLRLMRERAQALHDAFPGRDSDEIGRVLTQTRTWTPDDFGLLVDASRWFESHNADGLTPRQVPLEGFHAKWLNSQRRQSLICLLSGRDRLGLVDSPPSCEVAYLDPTYLAGGARRYDLYVARDGVRAPYEIRCAIVVENKDTYRYFPETAGAACIFGSGRSGPTRIRALPWIADVEHLVYWGDMDADGLEILNDYRAQGLAVESILMDLSSFERYERLGTSRAAGKQALSERRRRALCHLTKDEQDLYLLLTDPELRRNRRIEQERIPLEHAKAELERILDRRS